MSSLSIDKIKNTSPVVLLKLIQRAKKYLKSNEVMQDIFKEYNVLVESFKYGVNVKLINITINKTFKFTYNDDIRIFLFIENLGNKINYLYQSSTTNDREVILDEVIIFKELILPKYI